MTKNEKLTMTDKETLDYHIQNYQFEYNCRADYKKDLTGYIIVMSGATSILSYSELPILLKKIIENGINDIFNGIISFIFLIALGFLCTILYKIYSVAKLNDVMHPDYSLMEERNAELNKRICIFAKAAISLQKYNENKISIISEIRTFTFRYIIISIIIVVLVYIQPGIN